MNKRGVSQEGWIMFQNQFTTLTNEKGSCQQIQ